MSGMYGQNLPVSAVARSSLTFFVRGSRQTCVFADILVEVRQLRLREVKEDLTVGFSNVCLAPPGIGIKY